MSIATINVSTITAELGRIFVTPELKDGTLAVIALGSKMLTARNLIKALSGLATTRDLMQPKLDFTSNEDLANYCKSIKCRSLLLSSGVVEYHGEVTVVKGLMYFKQTRLPVNVYEAADLMKQAQMITVAGKII